MQTKSAIVTTVRLEPALHEAVKAVAEEHDLTMAAWIKRAVAKAIQADVEIARQNLAARSKVLDKSLAVANALDALRSSKAKGLRVAVASLAVDDGIASRRANAARTRAAKASNIVVKKKTAAR